MYYDQLELSRIFSALRHHCWLTLLWLGNCSEWVSLRAVWSRDCYLNDVKQQNMSQIMIILCIINDNDYVL